jgi:hypothetical protein
MGAGGPKSVQYLGRRDDAIAYTKSRKIAPAEVDAPQYRRANTRTKFAARKKSEYNMAPNILFKSTLVNG